MTEHDFQVLERVLGGHDVSHEMSTLSPLVRWIIDKLVAVPPDPALKGEGPRRALAVARRKFWEAMQVAEEKAGGGAGTPIEYDDDLYEPIVEDEPAGGGWEPIVADAVTAAAPFPIDV